jgi:hypothetical protein
MIVTYFQKTLLLRFTCLMIIAGSVFLYKTGLTDYVILLSLVLFAGGFFVISETTVTQQTVTVRKDYCWAMIPQRCTITYTQIFNLQPSIHDEGPSINDPALEYESEVGGIPILLGLFATVTWKNYILQYKQGDDDKHIVVKLTKDQYIDIWRQTKDGLHITPQV